MRVIVFMTLLVLTACSASPKSGFSPQDLLDTEQTNSQLLLSVADKLEQSEYRDAGLQLQLLRERGLTTSEQNQWTLLTIDHRLRIGEPEVAKVYLDQLTSHAEPLTPEHDIYLSVLRARWYETNEQYLAAARERDFLAALLTGQQRNDNHDAIWHNLLQIDEVELLRWAEQFPDTQFGHWLVLAAISKNSRLTLDEHLTHIDAWQQRHPNHPAALQLPGGLATLAEIAANRPTNITLLLPLSGQLEKTGHAIRDGFMAAWYESSNKGFAVPEVHLIDSERIENLDGAYQLAQFHGSQWLVGPFLRPQVQQLQLRKQPLPLPTLALNYGDREPHLEQRGPDNLYQFGLAAEDEAEQIARKAWADGHRRALALIPQGAWGERIFAAFEQHWLALGGEISAQRFYTNRRDYNPDIRAVLNIEDSTRRYTAMRRLLAEPTEFEPRRRADVDWIFLVALPQQARQIKPTLAFNFASDLPVYATSHVYSGIPNATEDRDLNGILFCDAPWLLQDSELFDNIQRAVAGGQGQYARLYAMGVDTFRLLPRLQQLQAFPNSQLFASTGTLRLDRERRIHRETSCTVFRAGRPVRLIQ